MGNFEVINLSSHTIKELSPMTIKREDHGITMGPDHKLYAIGGFDGKNSLFATERYNFKTNKWEQIANLNNARRSLCAVTLPDGVYAIGGYNGLNYIESMERYDENKKRWIKIGRAHV